MHNDLFSDMINSRFESLESKIDATNDHLISLTEKIASIGNGKTIHQHDVQLALLNSKSQVWSKWFEIGFKILVSLSLGYLGLKISM